MAVIKKEQLDLVQVEYEDGGKKAILSFMDMEAGELFPVNFNRRSYDNTKNEFIDDPEKEAKVDEWCKEYFDTTFDKLAEKVGEKRDIYVADGFNALWEPLIINSFEKEDEGTMIMTKIEEVFDDGNAIIIRFLDDDENMRQSKMNYSEFFEVNKTWVVDVQKRRKQFKKFQDKFGVSIEDKEGLESLKGLDIIVEVKLAFGKFPYAEIKPPKLK